MTSTTDAAAKAPYTFPIGAIVAARGREWVVQSGSTDQLLLLTPVAGADNETVGVLPAVERVEPAQFPAPTLDDLGDDRSARLLRDAVRLSVTVVPGPFRSFGKIAVTPRAYQLVPLMMALRLEEAPDDRAHPAARLLVADDVGVGKTVEAGLIARELLATGSSDGISVLCPPHLADQWACELADKFHLSPTRVLASTASRLERDLRHGESIFDRHPITVVSLDYVKSRRRRDDYTQTAPRLVIVDEAHLCAKDPANPNKHLRHELLAGLAADPNRHLVLVTATPHSGKEGAFRSLVGLLHPDLADVDPEHDLSGRQRKLLARHFVARKRYDVRHGYGADTPFPQREDLTDSHGVWQPTGAQRSLASDVEAWARGELSQARQRGQRDWRVRWWSVLGLLRALASSPAAAADTLRKRAGTAELTDDTSVTDVDEVGRQTTLDVDAAARADHAELDLGAQVEPSDADLLRSFADRADEMAGPTGDAKLVRAVELARELVDDGYQPIFFCRFIATAGYLAEHLAGQLDGVTVAAVTGETPSDQRERDVHELIRHDPRVLVATDCLAEGLNLQQWFSAVVHYDLPWSPTRLEQREGRVDRYGQAAEWVRVAALHGQDVFIDGLIVDVLLRKHRAIFKELGIAIPVPGSSEEVIEKATERLFAQPQWTQQRLLDDEGYQQLRVEFDQRWEDAKNREQRSRSKFAQHAIDPSEAVRQLEAAQHAAGDPAELARFISNAVTSLGGQAMRRGEVLTLRLDGLPLHLQDELASALGQASAPDVVDAAIDAEPPPGAFRLSRTHPFVAALSRFVVDAAIDRHEQAPASRVGVIATDAVDRRTALATLRFRHDLATTRHGVPHRHGVTHTMLVEDIATVALRRHGLADDLDPHALADADPTANLADADRREDASWALQRLDDMWADELDQVAHRRADELLEAHRRVRRGFAGGREAGFGRSEASTHLPPDVVGIHVLVPAANQESR
jgi:superfamily II DNA or RNA helicase